LNHIFSYQNPGYKFHTEENGGLSTKTSPSILYMLKFFVFVALTGIIYSCSVTKISWDKSKADKGRHIGTSSMEVKIDNAIYNFSLSAFARFDSKDYFLMISSLSRIDDPSNVLIKLSNNEIVKLQSGNVNINQIDWPIIMPIIGGPSPSGLLAKEKVDYYLSIYKLDAEVLSKIELNGIIKLGIQYGDIYREKNWVFDKLGTHIKESHELIESQLLKAPKTLKSMEENF
jgi:hypothetical protein